jgi:hypothetical protein
LTNNCSFSQGHTQGHLDAVLVSARSMGSCNVMCGVSK